MACNAIINAANIPQIIDITTQLTTRLGVLARVGAGGGSGSAPPSGSGAGGGSGGILPPASPAVQKSKWSTTLWNYTFGAIANRFKGQKPPTPAAVTAAVTATASGTSLPAGKSPTITTVPSFADSLTAVQTALTRATAANDAIQALVLPASAGQPDNVNLSAAKTEVAGNLDAIRGLLTYINEIPPTVTSKDNIAAGLSASATAAADHADQIRDRARTIPGVGTPALLTARSNVETNRASYTAAESRYPTVTELTAWRDALTALETGLRPPTANPANTAITGLVAARNTARTRAQAAMTASNAAAARNAAATFAARLDAAIKAEIPPVGASAGASTELDAWRAAQDALAAANAATLDQRIAARDAAARAYRSVGGATVESVLQTEAEKTAAEKTAAEKTALITAARDEFKNFLREYETANLTTPKTKEQVAALNTWHIRNNAFQKFIDTPPDPVINTGTFRAQLRGLAISVRDAKIAYDKESGPQVAAAASATPQTGGARRHRRTTHQKHKRIQHRKTQRQSHH